MEVVFQGDMFGGTINYTMQSVPRAGDQVTILTDDGTRSITGTVSEVNWMLSNSGQSVTIQLTSGQVL